MTEPKITELQSGFNTAFIDSLYNSNLAYRPQFIYNDNCHWIILYTKQIKEIMMQIDKNWMSHFSPLEIEYINYFI